MNVLVVVDKAHAPLAQADRVLASAGLVNLLWYAGTPKKMAVLVLDLATGMNGGAGAGVPSSVCSMYVDGKYMSIATMPTLRAGVPAIVAALPTMVGVVASVVGAASPAGGAMIVTDLDKTRHACGVGRWGPWEGEGTRNW